VLRRDKDGERPEAFFDTRGRTRIQGRRTSMNVPAREMAVAWGLAAAALNAQDADPPLAIERAELRTHRVLTVSSALFRPGEAIPRKYSAYADNISPPIRWTAVAGANSYMLLVEDPDAKAASSKPMLHWIVWDIPTHLQSLPEGLKNPPPGLKQGRNGHGDVRYMGMKPPAGDPPHHYHFEVFALDRLLGVAPGSGRDAVIAAAIHHVIAKGELVGTFEQKAPH
jgi:Raf kinase inhibitor-like YbhB/YbcL family protein